MTNDPTSAQPADNPLLDQRDLPRFAGFDPAQVTPAIDRLLVQAEAALVQATDPATPRASAATYVRVRSVRRPITAAAKACTTSTE